MRLGTLGLHLSPDPDALLAAAVGRVAGIDTADVYGAGAAHDTESRLPRLLPVQSKVGLVRERARWMPRGTAGRLRAAAERSLAFGPLDALLLHAIDPDVGLATSWRALLKLRAEGRVPRVGLCNVRVHELREAMALGRPDVVQVELSPFQVDALRTGLVRFCRAEGIAVQAHSPLGGHRRRGHAARELAPIAARHGVSAERLALRWLESLGVEPVVGCSRVETLLDACGPAPEEAIEEASRALEVGRRARVAPRPSGDREVVLVMGLAGSGKTTRARTWVERGYARFNRDELGGTLKGVVERIDGALEAGATGVVSDNTWLERATRALVVEVAERRGARVRVEHVQTPASRCQAQAVARILEFEGDLPAPEALEGGPPWRFGPKVIFAQVARFEPPDADEGFASIEAVPAPPRPGGSRGGLLVGLEALERGSDLSGPLYVAAWTPDLARRERLAAALRGRDVADVVTCPHPPGPPICWCRPPLPGLGEVLRVRHDLDPARVTAIGGPAERALAEACGFAFRAM